MLIRRAILVLAATLPLAAANEPVRIDTGMITGVDGAETGVHIYKGIPFAAPPVGDSRWKAPGPRRIGMECAPPTSSGRCACSARLATTRRSARTVSISTSTPRPPPPKEKRPVMVWIYGGALTGGRRARLRRPGPGQEGRGGGHLQLSAGRVRILRASRADQGIRPQRVRQLRIDGSAGRARMGAAEHRGLRRRLKRVTIFGESAGSWSTNMLMASSARARTVSSGDR